MNRVILMGRLTKDPDVRYTNNKDATAVGRYTLACDRAYKKSGEQNADFINCIAFGKNAEFAEKYLKHGMKIMVEGRIQTGSYTNRDGQKVYTTDVIVEKHEFAESKQANDNASKQRKQPEDKIDEFIQIPDNLDGDDLPFN